MKKTAIVSVMVYGNALIACVLAGYFFFLPGIFVVKNITDPALKTGAIPQEAWRLHRYLTPRYEQWARARIASKAGAKVHYLDVPGTEWPLFGSVFYLWATDNLQKAWEKDNSLSPVAPKVYAKYTIEACKDVLLDPAHHTWVKTHWGDDYMHDQNVFFRSLLITGLTSYENLMGTGECLPLLKDQAQTLADELDKSPFGVLYDYPQECYPIDVFAAVAWIKRSEALTGQDYSWFVTRSRRAFMGSCLDERGLIPWIVDPSTGHQFRPSRGIVNAHVLIFAPELYPEDAREWYSKFEENFWQETWYGAGWREFYRDYPNANWTYDVDSGPIIGGFSPSANAFGMAAAKANGRLDHSYMLSTQVLAASWPLPDGRLLGARLLSDWINAPYLGEAGILWQLTAPVGENVEKVRGGHWSGAIYIGFLFYFGISLLVFGAVALHLWQWHRRKSRRYRYEKGQLWGWGILVALGVVLCFFNLLLGVLLLLAARIFPRFAIKQQEAVSESEVKEVEELLPVGA